MIAHLYRGLLRLYPSAFYDQFADEMGDVFLHAQADAAQKGRGHLLHFYARELCDLLFQALSQHIKESNMKHLSKATLALTLLFSSLAIAALISLMIWGYAITPPASSALVAQIETITSIHPVQVDQNLNVHIVERAQLPSGEVSYYPPSQIIPALQSRLPINNAMPADAVLSRLPDKLRWYGVEPGFRSGVEAHTIDNGIEMQIGAELHTYTANDHFYYGVQPASGFLIEGTSAQGEALIFLNIGSRVGGDRHQYYAFLFSDSGEALSFLADQTYRYDVAGVEFFTFPLIALLIFLVLSLALLLAIAVTAIARRVGVLPRLAHA